MTYPAELPKDIEDPEASMSRPEFRNGMKGAFWAIIFSAPIWTILVCWVVTR